MAETTQARAADAGFLAFAPPPPVPGALCVVDTGVSVTPETQGALVGRGAVDPAQSPDDALGEISDGSLYPHGTLMVSLAFGPSKGIWPQGKAVSVNGLPVGQHAFPDAAYPKGAQSCIGSAWTHNTKAILLALGSPDMTGNQLALIENVVDAARAAGINVVAAAGNTPGPIEAPARYGPVFAVTAGDPNSDGLCSFSASGPEGDIAAPGCSIDETDPLSSQVAVGGGTSQASAIAAAVLVALRSYRPDLTVDRAEQLLTSTARNGHLDAAAAFDAAGLSSIVDSGNSALAASQPPGVQPSPSTPSRARPAHPPKRKAHKPRPARRRALPRWPAPHASFQRRNHGKTVSIEIRNRPRGARALVRVQREGEVAWDTVTGSARATTRRRLEVDIRPSWQHDHAILRLSIVYASTRSHRASQPATFRLR